MLSSKQLFRRREDVLSRMISPGFDGFADHFIAEGSFISVDNGFMTLPKVLRTVAQEYPSQVAAGQPYGPPTLVQAFYEGRPEVVGNITLLKQCLTFGKDVHKQYVAELEAHCATLLGMSDEQRKVADWKDYFAALVPPDDAPHPIQEMAIINTMKDYFRKTQNYDVFFEMLLDGAHVSRKWLPFSCGPGYSDVHFHGGIFIRQLMAFEAVSRIHVDVLAPYLEEIFRVAMCLDFHEISQRCFLILQTYFTTEGRSPKAIQILLNWCYELKMRLTTRSPFALVPIIKHFSEVGRNVWPTRIALLYPDCYAFCLNHIEAIDLRYFKRNFDMVACGDASAARWRMALFLAVSSCNFEFMVRQFDKSHRHGGVFNPLLTLMIQANPCAVMIAKRHGRYPFCNFMRWIDIPKKDYFWHLQRLTPPAEGFSFYGSMYENAPRPFSVSQAALDRCRDDVARLKFMNRFVVNSGLVGFESFFDPGHPMYDIDGMLNLFVARFETFDDFIGSWSFNDLAYLRRFVLLAEPKSSSFYRVTFDLGDLYQNVQVTRDEWNLLRRVDTYDAPELRRLVFSICMLQQTSYDRCVVYDLFYQYLAWDLAFPHWARSAMYGLHVPFEKEVSLLLEMAAAPSEERRRYLPVNVVSLILGFGAWAASKNHRWATLYGHEDVLFRQPAPKRVAMALDDRATKTPRRI